ncbi:hypothetical protein AKO1_012358 [Acrasis kona]|uniref:Uncharacterized protein n=1 Tax=Acrasis kona TaxID=1008807 RepID=A0AAW2YX93_9EUKA
MTDRRSSCATVADSEKIRYWHLLCAEFMTCVIRNESPRELFSAANGSKVVIEEVDRTRRPLSPLNNTSAAPRTRVTTIVTASEYSKKLLRDAMIQEHRQNMRQPALPSRHSRFVGSYVRDSNAPKKTMTISSSQVMGGVYKKPTKAKKDEEQEEEPEPNKLEPASQYVFHNVETKTRSMKSAPTKSKLLARDEMNRKISTVETKKIIKTFASELLKGGFNSFFKSLCSILINHDSTENSTVRAFCTDADLMKKSMVNIISLAAFALEFNECTHEQYEKARKLLQNRGREVEEDEELTLPNFEVSLVVNVFSEKFINHIFDDCIHSFQLEKRYVHLAQVVNLLRHLFSSLVIMRDNYKLRVISEKLTSEILYKRNRYIEISNLVRRYDPRNNSTHYLVNLVNLVHDFIQVAVEKDEVLYFHTEKNVRAPSSPSSTPPTSPGEVTIDEHMQEEVRNLKRLELTAFLSAFASCDAVRTYLHLLSQYVHLSTSTISQVLDMLNNIVKDKFNRAPLMFQISCLYTMNNIVNDRALDLDIPAYQELNLFARRLIRSFIDDCYDHPDLPKEILFWKDATFMKKYYKVDAIDMPLEVVEAPEAPKRRRNKRAKINAVDMPLEVVEAPEAPKRRRNERAKILSQVVGEDSEKRASSRNPPSKRRRVYSRRESAEDILVDDELALNDNQVDEDEEEEYAFGEEPEEPEEQEQEEEYTFEEETTTPIKSRKRRRRTEVSQEL